MFASRSIVIIITLFATQLALANGEQSKSPPAPKTEGEMRAAHDAYAAYSSEISSRRDLLELVAELDKRPTEVRIESEQIFGKTVPTIASLKTLDELCKAKHLTTVPIPPDYVGTKPSAIEGCRLAASYKELGKKYVELQAIGAANRKAEHYEQLIASARSGESIDVSVHHDMLDPTRAIAALRAVYDAAGEPFGVTSDPVWYEPIRAAVAKYPSAIDQAAKTSRWDADATQVDPAIKAAFAGDHGPRGGFEKGHVIKIGSFAGWSVETDEWKRPVSRSRSAVALVKIDGESFCRLYARSFDEHYVNGTWSRPTGRGGASFQISSCK